MEAFRIQKPPGMIDDQENPDIVHLLGKTNIENSRD